MGMSSRCAAVLVFTLLFSGIALAEQCRDHDNTDSTTCGSHTDKLGSSCVWCPSFGYGPYCVGNNGGIGSILDGCNNANYDGNSVGCMDFGTTPAFCTNTQKCILVTLEDCRPSGNATCRQFDNGNSGMCTSHTDKNGWGCIWCPSWGGYPQFCVGDNRFWSGLATDGCDTALFYDPAESACTSSGYLYCANACVLPANEQCLGLPSEPGEQAATCVGVQPPQSGLWVISAPTTCSNGGLTLNESGSGGIDIRNAATLTLNNVTLRVQTSSGSTQVLVEEGGMLVTNLGTSIGPSAGYLNPYVYIDGFANIMLSSITASSFGIGTIASAKANVTFSDITVPSGGSFLVSMNSQDVRILSNTIDASVDIWESRNAVISNNNFVSGQVETHPGANGTLIYGNQISSPTILSYSGITFEGMRLQIRENSFTSPYHWVELQGVNDTYFYKNNISGYGNLRFLLTSKNVTVEGNLIQGAGYEAIQFTGGVNRAWFISNTINSGAYYALNVTTMPNLTISRNTFLGSNTPLRIFDSYNETIDDNTFSNTAGSGIEITRTPYSRILNNRMSPKPYVVLTSSNYCVVNNNNFTTADTATAIMLRVVAGTQINVTNNRFFRSPSYGIEIGGTYVRFENNIITGGSRGGISVLTGGTNALIQNNKIINNVWTGGGGAYAVLGATSVSGMNVRYNNMSNNSDRVSFSASYFNFTYNNVTNNQVVTQDAALYIGGVSYGNITGNRIENNSYTGIQTDRGADTNGICNLTLSGNVISKNIGYGVYLRNCVIKNRTREQLSAENQWGTENPRGRILQTWVMRVHAINESGQNVATAYIDIRDYNNTKVYTALATDAAGMTAASQELTEYLFNNSQAVQLYTPHTINGSKASPALRGITNKTIFFPGTRDFVLSLSGGDKTQPVISNIRNGTVNGTAAVIYWDTDQPSDSKVNYSTTLVLSQSTLNATIAILNPHIVTLNGLLPLTLYYYNVTSCDGWGNCNTSGNCSKVQCSFTTTSAPADTTPPAITDVKNGTVTTSTADILWNTSEDSTSVVYYGTTPTVGSQKSDAALVSAHLLTLTLLNANTLYYYNVSSCDAAGNCANSTQHNFTTLVAVTNPPTIISGPAPYDTTSSSTRIEWATDYASNSTVRFGLSAGNLEYFGTERALVTSHAISIWSLASSTKYYYEVTSCNSAGCDTESGYFFITLSAEGEGAGAGKGAARVPELQYVSVLALFALAAAVFYLRSSR